MATAAEIEDQIRRLAQQFNNTTTDIVRRTATDAVQAALTQYGDNRPVQNIMQIDAFLDTSIRIWPNGSKTSIESPFSLAATLIRRNWFYYQRFFKEPRVIYMTLLRLEIQRPPRSTTGLPNSRAHFRTTAMTILTRSSSPREIKRNQTCVESKR